MIDLKNYYKALANTPFPDKKTFLNSSFNNFETELYVKYYGACGDNCTAQILAYLGYAFTRLKRHHNALEVDSKLASLMPDDPTVRYNLACSYSNLNDVEKALAELKKAIRLGYSDTKQLECDQDLNNLRADPRFQEMLIKLKNEKE